ncbi:MAG: DNA replication/repair protein RecF [Alphaproteobacteria bacterium]
MSKPAPTMPREAGRGAPVSDAGPVALGGRITPGWSANSRFAVSRLVLSEFRSYPALRLETDSAPVVLTGANGAGKTNLLEALSFLAPGRGLRRARLAEVARRAGGPNGGANGGVATATPDWAVAASLATPRGIVEIGTGRGPYTAPVNGDGAKGGPRDGRGDGSSGERRVVRIDGAPARAQSALAKIVSIVWLTPEMDRLFLGPASARRRFLDRLVYGFVPDHASRVGAYERAMRDRARLLREGRADADWLSALEAAMAENGVAVAAARRDVVARLGQATDIGVGPFPRPAISLAGTVESWLEDGPAIAAEDRLRGALAASRPLDAHTGGAADGPHRSDMIVHHVAKDMPAEICSTGGQKALLVALTLAVARLQAAERGAPPILLLDEITAHLDRARRGALFDEVCALGAQAWMTGTDASLFAAMRGRAEFFKVAGGRVAADNGDQ